MIKKGAAKKKSGTKTKKWQTDTISSNHLD